MHIKYTLIFASIFAASSVALGAFAAHGLESMLSERSRAIFETAVRYQMWHSFALFFVALIAMQLPVPQFKWASVLFILGVLLFSGSLYFLALGGPRWLGPITPLGGVCLIGAWVSVLLGVIKAKI